MSYGWGYGSEFSIFTLFTKITVMDKNGMKGNLFIGDE